LAGSGECRYVKSDFPERGINAGHCFLDLASDDQYVGGLPDYKFHDFAKGRGALHRSPGVHTSLDCHAPHLEKAPSTLNRQ
jgi:hypothetical protein